MTQASAVSLLAWLERHAALSPERPAAIHLAADGSVAWQLSWRSYADAVAHTAQALRARETRSRHAILMLDPDPSFAIAYLACLHSGLVSIPLPPFDPARGPAIVEQLQAIAADSGAALILCNGASYAGLSEFATALTGLELLPLPCPTTLATITCATPPDPSPSPACLLYTSGSTSAPKAVSICLEHLAYNASSCAQAWCIDDSARLVSWMPNHHSFGLIYNVVIPLCSGATLITMAPASFLARPRLWLETIQRFACSHAAAASFGYQYCVDRIDDLTALDLASLRVALISAEPVRRGTCEAFLTRFAAAGLRANVLCPLYGLSECGPITSMPIDTALAYWQPPGLDPSRSLACLGNPLPDCQVHVVDPECHELLPAGAIGEVWLTSPALMNGYHRRPEVNRDAYAMLGDQRFFRSGDRGFQDHRGLFITGRIKELVIVRGKNYDPQDLEWAALAALPVDVRGAATAFEDELLGQFHLAVEVAADSEHLARLADQAAQGVSLQHGIRPERVILLAPGTIPKTSSGKLRRGPCRDLLASGALTPLYVRMASCPKTPTNGSTPCLLTLFAQVLGLSACDLDAQDPLNSFDLDSLTVTNLTAAVADRFGKRLHPTAFYKCETLAELAIAVDRADAL